MRRYRSPQSKAMKRRAMRSTPRSPTRPFTPACSARCKARGKELSLQLPFAWRGVSLSGPGGASRARVALTKDGEELTLTIADRDGAPLAAVASLVTREISTEQLRRGSGGQADLFALSWRELPQATGTEAQPDVPEPIEPAFEQSGDPAKDALAATTATLELLQAHLQAGQGQEAEAPTVLSILTRGAFAAKEGESPDPAQAAIAGLIRSAQSEHPGRFLLIDADRSDASTQALSAAMQSAIAQGEGQLALREGEALIPRLARAGTERFPDQASPFTPGSTVLIAGSTGGLGALLATQLAEAHGVEAKVAGPGTSDRDQLEKLIEDVDPEHPLGAVIHLAANTEDVTVAQLEPAGLKAVFAKEAGAALALHELTADMDLDAFVVCPPAAAVLGGSGRGAGAAMGCFLDAFAHRRSEQGLPVTSTAIGNWDLFDAPEPEAERGPRSGILALSGQDVLEGLDAALASADDKQLVAVRLDKPTLRVFGEAGMLPPLLRDLIRTPARRSDADGAGLAARLRAAGDEAVREAIVLELVRNQVASVLGHDSAQAIGADQAFTELGFDSLAAVELRNRLGDLIGIELAPALAYDHPTPAAAAAHIRVRIEQGDGAADQETKAESEQISLGSMLATAREQGMATELIGLLAAAAAFRPKFDGLLSRDEIPAPVRLAEGPDALTLICLSSIVPMSGPHEYAEIAKELRGSREVLTLPQSGFVSGEPVPGTREAAVATQVEAVRRLVTDRPFALLGHSSGGLFAHAVAAKLEADDLQPAAVVLIDTYEMSEASLPIMMDLLAQIIFATEMSGGLSDTRLTAMGAYLPLLGEWEVPSIAAPALLVRASDPMPGMQAGAEWRTSWQGCGAEIEVPGDHLSMMHEHAASTVAAIEGWLATTAGAGLSGDPDIQTAAR